MINGGYEHVGLCYMNDLSDDSLSVLMEDMSVLFMLILLFLQSSISPLQIYCRLSHPSFKNFEKLVLV